MFWTARKREVFDQKSTFVKLAPTSQSELFEMDYSQISQATMSDLDLAFIARSPVGEEALTDVLDFVKEGFYYVNNPFLF